MKLIEIGIKNFRSLRDTDWLKIFDLTAFIGENDGGKTASCDAIKFLFDKNLKPAEGDFCWILNPENGELHRAEEIVMEAKLVARSEQEQTEIDNVLGQDTQSIIHVKKTFKIDGTITFSIIGQVPTIQEFRENWQAKTVADLKELAQRHSINLSGTSTKPTIIDAIQEWVNSQPTLLGEKAFPPSLLQYLPRVEFFSSSKVADPEEVVNNVLKLLCKNEISSGRYQGQIRQIEDGIRQSLREKVSEVTPFVKKYYDEVEGVNIDPIFNISSGLGYVPLKLYKSGGGPIELQRKGDGKKRQVALGIYEWSTEAIRSQEIQDDVVLIMDEPDTHLDYHSQRKLFDIICSYTNNSIQVLICTHSLNLINRLPVNKIHHYYLDEKNYSKVESLVVEDEETETMFINEIGLSLGLDTGTMFHERCFLVVEGPTELHAIPQFFKTIYNQSLQSAGIKLVNGENNGGVRNFAKFLNNNGRNVIFLLDNDCKTGPSKRIFTEESLTRDGFDLTNQVFFIGAVELEDAFEDDLLVILGNTYYPKTDSNTWEITDFSCLRTEGKFSEKLQMLFHDSKPNIGYHLGKVVSEESQIPQVIRDVLNKAYLLANSPRK